MSTHITGTIPQGGLPLGTLPLGSLPDSSMMCYVLPNFLNSHYNYVISKVDNEFIAIEELKDIANKPELIIVDQFAQKNFERIHKKVFRAQRKKDYKTVSLNPKSTWAKEVLFLIRKERYENKVVGALYKYFAKYSKPIIFTVKYKKISTGKIFRDYIKVYKDDVVKKILTEEIKS